MNCKICNKKLDSNDKGTMVSKSDKRYSICNECIKEEKVTTGKIQEKDKKYEGTLSLNNLLFALDLIGIIQLVFCIILGVKVFIEEESAMRFCFYCGRNSCISISTRIYKNYSIIE